MNQTRVTFDDNGKVCRPNSKESARLPECGVFDRPFVPQNKGDLPRPGTRVTESIPRPGPRVNESIPRPGTRPDESIPRAESQVTESREDRINSVVRSNVARHVVKYGMITNSEQLSARMTKASYINLTEGQHAAQLYTTKNIPGYVLDTELLNEHGAVFHNPQTNDLRLAYRGTQTNFDWTTNLRLATMSESDSSQIQALEKQMELIERKYGKKPDTLSGHSKGGGQAIIMGERHGIATHTQDPFVPTRHLVNSRAQHSIARTPTDWVSAGTNIAKFQSNIRETLVRPTAGNSLLQAHDLNVITGVEHQGNGNTNYNPRLKDHAFLIKQIQTGNSLEEVITKLGYIEGSADEVRVRETYANLLETEVAHPQVLRSAGYQEVVRSRPNIPMRAGAMVTSSIGTAASRLVNTRTVAGIGGGMAASEALRRLGLEDETTVATASGAIGNLTSDAFGELAATRAVSRNVSSSLAEVGARGLAAGVGRSLAKGGVGGILGFGVEYGTRAALTSLHVDETVTDIGAAAAGGAAAGAIFGPEGAVLGAAVGSTIAAVTDLVKMLQPKNDYYLQPFTNKAADTLIGSDPEIQELIRNFNSTADFEDSNIQSIQGRITDLVRQKARQNGWAHNYANYQAKLSAVPRGYDLKDHLNHPSVMLQGDYTVVNFQEAQMMERNAHATHSRQVLNAYNPAYANMTEEELTRLRDELYAAHPNLQQQYQQTMNLRLNRPEGSPTNSPEFNMYNALMIGEIVLQQNEISRQERSTVVDNRTRLRELLNQARSLGIHTSSFDDIVHSRGPPVSLESLTSQIQDMQIENNVNLLHQQLQEARQLGLDMPSYNEIVHQSGRGDGYTPQRITQELQEARSLPSNEAPRPTPQPEG